MANFLATSKSVIGEPTDRAWAEAFNFGSFFGVVSISADNPSLPSIGKDILDTLDYNFNHLQRITPPALFSCLSFIDEKYADLTICVTVAVLMGKLLYVINEGKGSALLSRDNKQAVILSPADRLVSGVIKSDDTLILFTPGFIELVPVEQVKQNLDHFSPDIICSSLTPLIYGKQDTGSAACQVIHFRKSDEDTSYQESEVGLSPAAPRLDRFFNTLWFKQFPKNVLVKIHLGLSHASLNMSLGKINRQSFRSTLFLRNSRGKSDIVHKPLFTIGVVLVGLLLIVLALGIKKRIGQQETSQFASLYSMAQLRYADGKALVDLNPVRARTLLSDSKQTLEQARMLVKNNKSELAKIDSLLNNISVDLESASGIYKISDATQFFDLSLVKDKGTGSKTSFNNGKIVILDSQNKSVYATEVADKNVQIVSGGNENFTNSMFISLHGDFAYVFSSKGVMEIDTNAKTSKVVVKTDSSWGEIGGLVEFGAFRGNIYLLDKKNSRILKYTSSDSGFVTTKDYLSTDIKPDFLKATNMMIDGSVWVMLSDGSILRFTSGNPDYFNLSGLDTSFSSNPTLYTDSDCKNLYVLDPGNKRIVVIDKDKKMGSYKNQYVWEGLAKVNDFVVDEGGKKIYILLGSKIFTIDLK